MDPVSICLFLFLPAFLYLQLRLEHSWAKAILAKFQGILSQWKESKVDCLHSRAISLVDKFNQEGGNNYIEEAIDLDRKALLLCPPGYRMRPASLTWLAYHLWHRYRQLGVGTVLVEAVGLAQEGLDFCSSGNPTRPMSLHTLAVCLFTRYNKDGGVEDLHKSTVLNEEALKLRSPGHPDRWLSLNNLAANLFARYELLGVVGDLDAAIVLDQEALTIYPQGHSNRISSLNSLAIHLSARHTQLHVIQDLERGIALVREALEGYPRGNPLRSTSLNNLALLLYTRYNALKVMGDLDEAILLGQEALSLHPPGHPDRSKSLNNLATRFSTRYKQRGVVEDLNEAICLDKQALELRPPGDPLRHTSLNNLGLRLFARYEQLGAVEDINEATILGRQALQLCPLGHPSRSRALHNLAGHLRSRFVRSGQVEDKEALFNVYIELVGVSQVISYMDLHAARAWTRVAEELEHPSAILAYETSFRFLTHHVTTLPSLTQHLGILKNFISSLAVDAFSACLRSRLPERAVELLEQGRGVFWNQIIRLRSPLDDVVASGPKGEALAHEFRQLALQVRDILNSRSTDQHDRLCHLSIEIQRVESFIRELPGLEHFLLPPRFSDLRRSASRGPVIIVNGSNYSCDALVVVVDRDPVHISLQISQEDIRALSAELRTITERAKRVDMTKELASFLRRLWDRVVSPIVNILQTFHPTSSRIWWCPTADFSFLPLHAAGPYRKGQLNLSDLYVSSYTPSLSALIRARHCGTSNSEPASGRKCFIAIGQAKASGERALPELVSVATELTNINQRVDGLAAFTRLEGPEACISRVAEEMCKNQWVHLACHGVPNPKEPFKSAFALHDGLFTIEHIIKCKLENPEFAYLSACQTTVGYDKSPDEAIHLASAMQFAGFRSVVGTMWAVDDGETNKVTSTFYKHMVDKSGRLDHTHAAFALNQTMKSVKIAFDQRILYIHIGA